ESGDTVVEFYLITFENTSSTMKAESHLKKEGYNLMIMPTPTFITKSCGISVRIQPDLGEKIKEVLDKGEIQFKAYYKKESGKYVQVL
ncbi:MAG: DUF3343 domain-containing protein, partial [Bacillota bacterium]|nr:DUF3343 domain-containing protein [Bacillota bacterium]